VAVTLPARCIDLTAEHVAEAVSSKDAMEELLGHMARIARPGEGAPKILVPIARMATTECEWLEGGLVVTVSGTATLARLLVAVDLGVGMRELLFPRLQLAVPRAEFVRAIKVAPALVHPMLIFFEKDAIVLKCESAAMGTMPPPAFEIAEASIRRSLPPAVRRSLPPLYSDLGGLKVDIPDMSELDLLTRAMKRAPVPRIEEIPADPRPSVRGKTVKIAKRSSKSPPRPKR
jgi:hypothetical protein